MVVTGAVLLHVALGVPFVVCIGLAVMPRRAGDRLAPWAGVAASALTLLALLGAAVLAGRDRGGHFRLVTDAAWAPALDLRWHLTWRPSLARLKCFTIPMKAR